jgi:transcriptional regulator of nitric oxide reductase
MRVPKTLGRNALLLTGLAAAGSLAAGQAKSLELGRDEARLRAVLPDAQSFTAEEGFYRHFRGYAVDASGEKTLVGLAFSTRDLGARSRGFNGPIEVLVGLDLTGHVTGVQMLEHYEPFGYRSIDLPEYAAQLRGKSVLEPFEVGEDVDGTTGATMTVTAATRSIRHAARRIAKEFLTHKPGDGR